MELAEGRGRAGGCGYGERRRRLRSGITGKRGKERARGGGAVQRERGSERGGRGGAWRHRGVEEEAGGGQGKQEVAGAASAPATHLFVLLAEEEDDKGEEVGWAALGRSCWATRWASQVSPGGSALFAFVFIYLFCSVLF